MKHVLKKPNLQIVDNIIKMNEKKNAHQFPKIGYLKEIMERP